MNLIVPRVFHHFATDNKKVNFTIRTAIGTMTAMEIVKEALVFTGKVVLFFLLSIIFLPSYLIVNYLQEPWSKMLGDLF